MFLPGEDGVKVAAFLVGAEIGEWFILALAPAVGDGVKVGVALESLKDHASAVVEVSGEHEWRIEAKAVTPVVIVIDDERLPQRVEAMDLMEHVQFDHVVTVQSPVVWWNDGFIWVLAKPNNVLARDRVNANVGNALPSRVDFRTWRKTVDVGRVGLVIEESRIVLSRDERDVDAVKDRCWKMLAVFIF